MLYHLFVDTMNFLDLNFGYVWAIRIKLLTMLLAGVIIGTYISVWLVADFFLNVERNPLILPNVAILGPTEDNPKFTADPKNSKEAVEAVFGYIISKTLRVKTIFIRNLTRTLWVYALFAFVLIFFAVLLSWWVYLPPTEIVK